MIGLDYRDEFAILSLDRPAVLNALNFATLRRLEESGSTRSRPDRPAVSF